MSDPLDISEACKIERDDKRIRSSLLPHHQCAALKVFGLGRITAFQSTLAKIVQNVCYLRCVFFHLLGDDQRSMMVGLGSIHITSRTCEGTQVGERARHLSTLAEVALFYPKSFKVITLGLFKIAPILIQDPKIFKNRRSLKTERCKLHGNCQSACKMFFCLIKVILS